MTLDWCHGSIRKLSTTKTSDPYWQVILDDKTVTDDSMLDICQIYSVLPRTIQYAFNNSKHRFQLSLEDIRLHSYSCVLSCLWDFDRRPNIAVRNTHFLTEFSVLHKLLPSSECDVILDKTVTDVFLTDDRPSHHLSATLVSFRFFVGASSRRTLW